MDFPITYRIDAFSVFMFLGVVQGFFLSWIFLTNRKNKDKTKYYLGFIILNFSLVKLEIFLCYSGLIVQVLHYYDFSEPTNFLFGPLLYLFSASIVDHKPKFLYLHFIPFILYFLYSCFFFFQGLPFKYNAFLWAYHPDWARVEYLQYFPDDPLHLKQYINELGVSHVALYLFPIFQNLKSFRQKKHNPPSWFWSIFFLLSLSYLFWVYKTIFVYRDFSDHISAAFNTFIIYFISYIFIRNSLLLQQKSNQPKYSKSSLAEQLKTKILSKANYEMEVNKAYLDASLSLKKIATKLETSVHHLSQVLNEKLNKSYYEWIAEYRVAEAKRLLVDPSLQHYKLEEIGKMAGFNSKSAFYKAFKKLERVTPAEYRSQSSSF